MSQIQKFVNGSSSFFQDQNHSTKTERFVTVKPADVEKVLNGFGFDLVNLRTGRAKKTENADHQTTIARYRSRDQFAVNGMHFDLVFKIPHLYDAIQGMLALMRLVCSNGLVAGRDFTVIKVSHLANQTQQLGDLIPQLIAQRQNLVDQIKAMQSRIVTPRELAELSEQVARIRLGDAKSVSNIETTDLLKVRRDADKGSDLFTVLNVLQENAIRYGIRYQSVSEGENGIKTVRQMSSRPLTRNRNSETEFETAKSVETNASIWDAAANLLKSKTEKIAA